MEHDCSDTATSSTQQTPPRQTASKFAAISGVAPDPMAVINEAARQIENMKYAIGAAAVVAVVALSLSWVRDPEIMIVGVPGVFALMLAILVFQKLFSKLKADRPTGFMKLFAWSYLIMFSAYPALLGSSTLFAWPIDLTNWLGKNANIILTSGTISLRPAPTDQEEDFERLNPGWNLEIVPDAKNRVRIYRREVAFDRSFDPDFTPMVYVELPEMTITMIDEKTLQVYVSDVSSSGFVLNVSDTAPNSHFVKEVYHVTVRWTAVSSHR